MHQKTNFEKLKKSFTLRNEEKGVDYSSSAKDPKCSTSIPLKARKFFFNRRTGGSRISEER
jgi:hypothetical protein